MVSAIAMAFAMSAHAGPITINLGSDAGFAVLAGTSIANTGATTVSGNVGVSPKALATGFPPGIISSGTLHSNDAVAVQAQTDLAAAYSAASGESCGTDLTSQDLGGLVLTPGSYCFASSAQLTGILTLDALGDPNAVFLFQVGSALTTASNASVDLIDGGDGDDVFWQIGSSATLGAATDFTGTILAQTSITLGASATLSCGRALAEGGIVTLNTNTVSIDTPGCGSVAGSIAVPEPATASLLGFTALVTMVIGAANPGRLRLAGRNQKATRALVQKQTALSRISICLSLPACASAKGVPIPVAQRGRA